MPNPLSIEEFKQIILNKYVNEDLDLSQVIYNKRYIENIICNKCKSVIRKRIDHILKDNKCMCINCLNKSRRLTEKDVIDRLFKLDIILLEPYVNTATAHNIQCIKCDYIWKKKLSNVVSGEKNKCPKCYGKLPLTNDIVDDRLKDTNIKRIGNFISTSIKIEWECKVCNYHWDSSPRNILHENAHCPSCSNCIPLSNERIDEKIKDRPIIRIGNFTKNNSIKIEWKCKICDHQWKQHPNGIFNGRGCPKCKMSKGELLIEQYLKDNNIKYEIQKMFDNCRLTHKLPFDFYLPEYNLCIEYQGIQHFKPINHFGGIEFLNSLKIRDQFKKQYCIDNGINFLEISYKDFNNIEEILKPIFNK